MENILAIAGLASIAGLSLLAALFTTWLFLESFFLVWQGSGVCRPAASALVRKTLHVKTSQAVGPEI